MGPLWTPPPPCHYVITHHLLPVDIWFWKARSGRQCPPVEISCVLSSQFGRLHCWRYNLWPIWWCWCASWLGTGRARLMLQTDKIISGGAPYIHVLGKGKESLKDEELRLHCPDIYWSRKLLESDYRFWTCVWDGNLKSQNKAGSA